MKRERTGIKLIIVLLLAILLVVIATGYSLLRVQNLVQTVERTSQPDSLRIKLDQLVLELETAENNMRAFAISDDEKYYVNFQRINAKIDADTSTFLRLSSQLPLGKAKVHALIGLLAEKKQLHENLLKLKYKSIVENTLQQLDTTAVFTDTTTVTLKEKQRFFSRLFNRRKIEKQLVSDSVAFQRDIIDSLKLRMISTQQKAGEELSLLATGELLLLNKSEKLSEEIRDLLLRLQEESSIIASQNAAVARNEAKETGQYLQGFAIVGSILLLLLVLAIFRDLISARRIRKDLAEAREKAEQLAASREAFLADMSHEMRTPLSAVNGLSSLLKETALDPIQQEYVKAIRQSSSHLLELLNDLLDEAYLQTGKLRLEEIPFSPADLIQDVAEILLPKAREKGLQLNIEVKEINNLWVKGDPLRLKQILFNLAGNGIKYSLKGSVTIKAAILDESPSLRRLQLEISDEGQGMSAEQLERLFERFEKGTGTPRESTGLGLYITKKFIDLHKGTITPKSTLGVGTTFIVSLPYSPAAIHVSEKEGLPFSLRGKSILVAEDDEWNRTAEALILSNYGAEVTTAEDGLKAWELLQSNAFDVAFFDLQMPALNGAALIERLRKEEGNPNRDIPVYALTAAYLRDQKEQLIQAGFTAVLQKPMRKEELHHLFIEEPKMEATTPSIHNEKYSLSELMLITKNDTAAVNHFIALFLKNTGGLLGEMHQRMETLAWKEASNIAHKLIPSCKQFKAVALIPLLEKIQYWSEVEPDKQDAERLVKEMEREALQLMEELNQYLDKNN
ncbi:ATP-binding protein [soil metagenome]